MRALHALLPLLLACGPVAAQSFEERYRERVAAFEAENRQLPATARTVVLLGSSSMEGWKHGDRVARFLPAGRRYLNRGISGDGVRGVIRRLDASVFDCKPSHVFVLVGQNSIGGNGQAVERTAREYREMVDAIKARLPGVVLALVTCQPTSGNYAGMARGLVAFNEHIRRIGRETSCPIVDLHPRLVAADGLSPRAGLSNDGLHFKDEGYRILGELIGAVLSGAAPPAANPPPATTPPATTPPPTTPPPTTSPPTERSYVVRPGDTLGRIAKRFGTTTAELVRRNRLANPNLIRVGQRLSLPPAGGLVDALTPG